jgi:hypothetical protein
MGQGECLVIIHPDEMPEDPLVGTDSGIAVLLSEIAFV